MSIENLNNILQNFNFSQAEAELYSAALKFKKATVSELAQKSGMGRTVAYFHVKNLIAKKIFREIKRGRKIFISPISPAELAEKFQREVSDFKTIIPQLEILEEAEKEIPEVEIQESIAGFEKIYDEICHLPISSELKVIEDKAGAEAELQIMKDEHWNNFFRQIAERKIITKAIFTEELLSDINKSVKPENYALVKKRMWNIHTLPEEKIAIKNFVLLYNKKVSFLFPSISLVISIKHKVIYDLINTLFETIFGLAKKVDNPWGKNSL